MIKEKFRDLPEGSFVMPEGIPENYAKNYLINKRGEVKGIKFNKILSSNSKDNYPCVMLHSSNKKEKPLRMYLHRLVALTFLENDDPENKREVDHINRNKSDFHVNNLRWVTRLDNLKNLNRVSPYSHCFYQRLSDDKLTVLESISFRDISRKDKGKIADSINNNTKFNGSYWKRYDPLVDNYISKYGIPKEEDWKSSPINGIECNKNGLIRYSNGLRIITVGTKNRDGYRVVNRTLVSRLVYSTFIENILKDSNVIIDHINTDREDNRIDNLRKTDSKGNANNATTIKQKKIKVIGFDIFGNKLGEFESSSSAAEKVGVSRCHINSCCLTSSYTVTDSYVYWCYAGEESTIPSKVNSRTIFEYDQNRALIAGYLDIKSVRKNYGPITDSIMTRRSCSINGHYYSIGPKDLTDENSWLPYKNYKRNYDVRCFSFNSKGELSGAYESITEASRATGIPRLKISNCCEFGDTVSKKKNADYTFWCFNESGIDNILRSRIHKYSANGLLINTYKMLVPPNQTLLPVILEYSDLL